jgi:hypothetical protein
MSQQNAFTFAPGVSCSRESGLYRLKGRFADFLRTGFPADWFSDLPRSDDGRVRYLRRFRVDGQEIRTNRGKSDWCIVVVFLTHDEYRNDLPPQTLLRFVTAHKGALAKIMADLPAIADSLRAEVSELYRPGPARP